MNFVKNCDYKRKTPMVKNSIKGYHLVFKGASHNRTEMLVSKETGKLNDIVAMMIEMSLL